MILLKEFENRIYLHLGMIILCTKIVSLVSHRLMSRDPDSHPLFTSNVAKTRELDNDLVEGIKALEKDDTPDEVRYAQFAPSRNIRYR